MESAGIGQQNEDKDPHQQGDGKAAALGDPPDQSRGCQDQDRHPQDGGEETPVDGRQGATISLPFGGDGQDELAKGGDQPGQADQHA